MMTMAWFVTRCENVHDLFMTRVTTVHSLFIVTLVPLLTPNTILTFTTTSSVCAHMHRQYAV
jgi:hypothetical protein